MIVERGSWDDFVRQQAGSFLHSWDWGEVQHLSDFDHWRLTEEKGDQLAGVALVIKRKLPLNKNWLYVPHGLLEKNKMENSPLLQQVVTLAQEQKSIFVKIENAPKFSLPNLETVAAKNLQPQHTAVLDLEPAEDDLLAGMHQKTRYNIRLAQKRGVVVRFSREEKDLEKFFQLAREVEQRGQFHYHSDDYYKNIVKSMEHAEVVIAEKDGQALSAAIIVSFGDTATYVHGASSNNRRELMAPHLMQWEAIRRAKNHGFKKYDFYGVAPEGAEVHPWAGITRFKLGFGAKRSSYSAAQDIVLRPFWYKLYKLLRKK